MAIIDITTLQNEAVKYQPELRFYPYYILGPELAADAIALKQVANKDVITSFERKAGIMRPYDPATMDYADLGKAVESALTVNPIVGPLKDSIKNYQSVQLLNNPTSGDPMFNQQKKHPLERLVVTQAIRTFSEDILFSIYGGVRNILDRTPAGGLDGYDKIIDDKITATEISLANGNLVNTGVIASPIDANDTSAVDALVTFVRAAHPLLKRNAILKITQKVYQHAIDALQNVQGNNAKQDVNILQEYINAKCNSNVRIRVSQAMGDGTRIVLTTPGNFDLGFNTFTDTAFVQVRNPWEDPNLVQFWIQADIGARIISVHKKVFQVNEQAASHVSLAGDYSA